MLQSIERELEEFSDRTAALARKVSGALAGIALVGSERDASIIEITAALQGVGQIETRCNGLALAIRQYALLRPGANDDDVFAEIWHSAGLDIDTSGMTESTCVQVVDLDDLGLSNASSFGFLTRRSP